MTTDPSKNAQDWLAENKEALDSSNAFVAMNGLPLARYRHTQFKETECQDETDSSKSEDVPD